MVTLAIKHPSIYAQFLAGNFTVKKTTHAFSAIALDQAHEQNNASVKGDGGAVGLTENPAALRRWMVSGPEMARVITEFQGTAEKRMKKPELKHHEHIKHTKIAFARDVKSLTGVMGEMGNPFCDDSKDLLVLDSRDLADPAFINTVCQIEILGQEQYDTYVNERLVNQTKPITNPIKRNNLPLFSRPPVREKSRSQLQVSSLKNDCFLFSRLFIASQTRDGDLDEFFAHENQACPPELSYMGKMWHGTKSDLVRCLEDLIPPQEDAAASPPVEVMILDGAAIVNMLPPGNVKTFSEYASQVFLPYIKSQLQHTSRVDIVWDEYFPESLKAETRQKRGKGIRRRVKPFSSIPGNWQVFLHIDKNKVELFTFLETMAAAIETEKQIISTHHKDVLCTQSQDVGHLAPCSHKEADTRILLHVGDAVKQGYTKVSIRTVDTDVVVLAVTAVGCLDIDELWVAFAKGKNFRFLTALEMAVTLGPIKCRGMPFFHAFAGCDIASSFGGMGKKTAWETWKACDEVTDITAAFGALADMPNPSIINNYMDTLEHFVALLYDRTSSKVHVNEARKHLFTQNGRSIDAIPPTREALRQESCLPSRLLLGPDDGMHTRAPIT